jgi:hypothetical protein
MKAELSRYPQNIDETVWYYEEPKGLTVCVSGPGPGVRQFTIPWRKVLASARHKQALDAARKINKRRKE